MAPKRINAAPGPLQWFYLITAATRRARMTASLLSIWIIIALLLSRRSREAGPLAGLLPSSSLNLKSKYVNVSAISTNQICAKSEGDSRSRCLPPDDSPAATFHRISELFREIQTAGVRDQDSHLLKTVERYLPEANDWKDLESALAAIDVEAIIDDREMFMPSYAADDWSDSGHHDFQYEVDLVVKCLSVELRHRFGQWIRQLGLDPTLHCCHQGQSE
jgi:hypothetical protein